MAVIWQKRNKSEGAETLYEVRSAGRTRRLYTNGVFHSQYNPASPVSGSVWDLLLLPAFFQSLDTVKRVLVLGVGGGAVIKQLEYFLKPEAIVGIELNPIHLSVAKRFFGVRSKKVELIQTDAIAWLKNYKGPKFDLIIDDLFGDVDGEPSRAIEANEVWCRSLITHLNDNGALVVNFDQSKGLRQCGLFLNPKLDPLLVNAWEFSTPLYANAIGCFTRQALSKLEFKKQLQTHKALDERLMGCRLNYRLKAIRL